MINHYANSLNKAALIQKAIKTKNISKYEKYENMKNISFGKNHRMTLYLKFCVIKSNKSSTKVSALLITTNVYVIVCVSILL